MLFMRVYTEKWALIWGHDHVYRQCVYNWALSLPWWELEQNTGDGYVLVQTDLFSSFYFSVFTNL